MCQSKEEEHITPVFKCFFLLLLHCVVVLKRLVDKSMSRSTENELSTISTIKSFVEQKHQTFDGSSYLMLNVD